MSSSAERSRTVYLNGKFCAQPTTGVQRVAAELVRALDAQRPPGRWVLLLPPGAPAPLLSHIEPRTVGPAGLPHHAWEQLVLPWAARDGWLLSLAGAAPALARRHVAMLHDAAVFDRPQAYRPLFVAWYRWLFRRLARRADALLTVSEFSRLRLVAALGPAAQRLRVILNGADHLDRARSDPRVLDRLGLRGRPFLLAVGSANPAKNQAALVEAHRRLGPAAPPLVLVGGRRDAVFAASAPAAGAQALEAGPVDDAALVALYGAALALVFPSLYEGFGLPPLEAMRLGCPVIASREASIPEVCGDAAYYLDGTGADAIEQGLRRVLGDAALRRSLGEAGRRRSQAFAWHEAAVSLRAVLRGLGAVA